MYCLNCRPISRKIIVAKLSIVNFLYRENRNYSNAHQNVLLYVNGDITYLIKCWSKGVTDENIYEDRSKSVQS